MADKQEILKLALERFDRVARDERDQRDKAVEDTLFAQVEGGQWNDYNVQQRRNRPRFEINKVALPVNQAIGDQRQSRIAIKIRPATSGTDEDTAKAFEGLIRKIEINSNFDKTKDNAYKEVTNGGFGAWYVVTEFNDDDSFEQDIVIKKITSASTSVYMDPTSKDDNKKDAMWGFVIEEISNDVFKAKYPDAVLNDFSTNDQPTMYRDGWRTQDTVRIADYWIAEPITKEIALFTNGKVYELNDDTKKVTDELQAEGITIATDTNGNEKRRKVKSNKITHYKMSGAEILEGPHKWAGKYIPIVVTYGYNMWINGVHYFRGMVRLSKDSQRVYNHLTSQGIEASALSPKDPFWITPKQAQGYERQFESFNVNNNPFLFYNPDPEAPGAPQRTGAPAVQSALIQQIAQADADIQATTGRFAPSLGDNPQEQSGRAVIAVQQQGEAGTYELIDNLAGAVEFTGEILVDLIPKIYDTFRQERILNPDGTTEIIEVNKTVYDNQTQKPVILNDLSQGKYSVVSDTGPSYKTQRTEALNFLNALSQSSPLFAQLAPDLLAKNVDFEFNEELTERVRKMMLQQGLIEPNEKEQQKIAEEQQQQQPNPMELLTFEGLKLDLEEKAARIDKIELENEQVKADIANSIADTEKKIAERDSTNAGTAQTMVEAGLRKEITPEDLQAEQDIDGINQTIVNTITELEQQDALQGMQEQQQQQLQQQQQEQQQRLQPAGPGELPETGVIAEAETEEPLI